MKLRGHLGSELQRKAAAILSIEKDEDPQISVVKDMLENKVIKKEQARHRIDGELLMDNQDVCMMLNISKRTLQRYRSTGKLPFKRIDQKTYYLESAVRDFIRKHLK